MRYLIVAVTAAACSGCHSPAPLPVAPSPVAARLTLTAQPASVLRSGSTSTIAVHVTDAHGTNVVGSPVELSTDTGTLTATLLTTDANGNAVTALTAASAATIRASSPGLTRELDVPVMAPFTLSVAPVLTPVYTGTRDVMITITAAPGITQPAAQPTLALTCGDAAPAAISTGNIGSCAFSRTGATPVTATATTPNGWSTTAATTVTVLEAPVQTTPAPSTPPAATLHAGITCGTTTTTRVATCNVLTLAYGNTALAIGAVTKVGWDWGDGGVTNSSEPYATRTYDQQGTYTVTATVTATTTDGSKSGTAAFVVTVPKT